MIFCGDCGFQMPPNTKFCPRCGAATEPNTAPESVYTGDNATIAGPPSNQSHAQLDVYGPTIASSAFPVARPSQPDFQTSNSPLTGDDPNFAARRQIGNPATPIVGLTPYETPPSAPAWPNSPPNYAPQNAGQYIPPAPPYPVVLPQNNLGYPAAPSPYTTPPSQQPPQRRGNGRPVVVITILFCVLLILGAVVTFLLIQQGYSNPSTGQATTPPSTSTTAPTSIPTPSPTATFTPTPTLTPTQQAQTAIQQLYDDINNRDYQSAYNIWGQGKNPQTLSQYAQGFSNTLHDDITFGPVTLLPDGTINVALTINATEQTSSGIVHSIFQGSYILGQENGLWKIWSASFQKTG